MISVLRELLINNRHVKRRDNVVAVKPIYVPESLIEQNFCSDYALDGFSRLCNE